MDPTATYGSLLAMNAFVRFATFLFIFALPVSVFAQTPQELAEARTHYQAGEAKFKAGDFETALKEFRLAEAVKATPHAARYIGLSADKLGRHVEAVAAYERFLTDVPAKLENEKETVKKRIGEIKAMPGTLKVTTHPADAKVAIDGQAALPGPRDFTVPPGKHTIKVTSDGWTTAEQDVTVTFAAKQDLHVKLEKGADSKTEVKAVAPPVEAPKTDVSAPVEPPKEPKSMVPVYVTAGIAGAALVTGSIFGILALGDSSDFKKNPTTSTADSGETKALVADLCLGLAVTFGVTSIVLAVTRDEEPKAADDEKKTAARSRVRITPTPFVTPHGAGAGAVIRF